MLAMAAAAVFAAVWKIVFSSQNEISLVDDGLLNADRSAVIYNDCLVLS